LIANLKEFFPEEPNVLLVFLFGSAVREQMRPESDIDIGILFKKEPDIFETNRLAGDLGHLLKREVDIANLNFSSPILKMQVLKNGILIQAKDDKYYHRFFVETLRQYFDLKQVRKICEENILKGRIYVP